MPSGLYDPTLLPAIVSARCAGLSQVRADTGTTLIELLTVLAVMGILAGISVPAIMGVVARSRLTADAETIERAHRQARQLAMSTLTPLVAPGRPAPHFGVVIARGSDGGLDVALLHGTCATDEFCADEDGDGAADSRRLHRWRLRQSTRLLWSGSAGISPIADRELGPSERLHWFYRYGSGVPIAVNAQIADGVASPSEDIGVGSQEALDAAYVNSAALGKDWIRAPRPRLPGGTVSALAVASGRFRAAIAIYSTGLVRVAEVRR